MIIDESDGTLTSAAEALDLGYAGTSHKNCKGVFKGIASACLIADRRKKDPGRAYILSSEDLGNVGPVALLQDLAVAASLGVGHTERNGHHYFSGLSMYPDDVQSEVLRQHGSLYRRHEAGFPTLDVRGGRLNIASVVDAPFGYRVRPGHLEIHPAGKPGRRRLWTFEDARPGTDARTVADPGARLKANARFPGRQVWNPIDWNAVREEVTGYLRDLIRPGHDQSAWKRDSGRGSTLRACCGARVWIHG